MYWFIDLNIGWLQNDVVFNIGLKLKMYTWSPSDAAVYNVNQSCSYSQWASREILCDRNYMEVGPLPRTAASV